MLADRDAKLAQATKDEATEQGRLRKLREEVDRAQASSTQLVSEATARLEAREKTLAVDGSVKTSRSRRRVRGKPLATPEDGLAGLLPKLAEALEGIATGVDSMVEGECRARFTAAATRVFNHLHLREPSLDLSTLIEQVAPESRNTIVEAVKK
nr:uncharacterized protein LOC109743428 [Aegilops tauschii subsp. strangulata]